MTYSRVSVRVQYCCKSIGQYRRIIEYFACFTPPRYFIICYTLASTFYSLIKRHLRILLFFFYSKNYIFFFYDFFKRFGDAIRLIQYTYIPYYATIVDAVNELLFSKGICDSERDDSFSRNSNFKRLKKKKNYANRFIKILYTSEITVVINVMKRTKKTSETDYVEHFASFYVELLEKG